MQLPARIALWTIALALLAAVAGAQPDASDTKALGPITHESLARAGVTFEAAQSRGVFIGVNAYTSSLGATRPPNLKSCVNDAVDLAAAFWGLGLIEPAGITLVLSGTPSKHDSAAALERLRAAGANVAANARRDTIDEAVAAASAAAGPDGILFLAWSAHGFELNGVQYLTPENFYASADPPPMHEIQSRALSEATLASVAQRSPAARRVLLFDACRESKAFAPGIPQLIAGAAGMVTLYAVTSGELALDGSRNGAFTARVLEALTSPEPPETLHADPHGHITVRTLLDFLGTAGRVEDTKILDMPLRQHPREFAAAGARLMALEHFRAAKRLDLDAPTGQRVLDGISLGALEEALLTTAGPRLVAEIEAELDTVDKRADFRRRRSFAAAWRDLSPSAAAARVTPPPVATARPLPPSLGIDELLALQEKAREEWTKLQRLDALDSVPAADKARFYAAYVENFESSGHEIARARERERHWREWRPTPAPTATPTPTPTPAGRNAGDKQTLDLGSGVSMTLVWIPPGTFTMGSPSNESGRDSDEGPQTRVTLSRGFWMGETEVTQAQWKAVMGSGNNPSNWKGDILPVERVSWNDAMDFCRQLSQRSGRTVTLPTEAQWEYACRAGTTTRFSFGDSDSALGNHAWFDGNSGRQTRPVRGKQPNAWGLYDMHGNVWEWCADWYADKLPGGSVTDPTGPSSGSGRVLRGGSWDAAAGGCRSAYRLSNRPAFRDYRNGFRVLAVQ